MNAIADWFLAKDWRTWLSHVLMGFVLAVVTASTWTALFVYFYREVEQVWVQWRTEGSHAVQRDATDHLVDFLAPFFVLSALVLFGVLNP